MKKTLIMLIIFALFGFNSCTQQEKMNAEIFVERFMELSDSSVTIEDNFNYDGKNIVFFRDAAGTVFVCELSSDGFGNIKKICLAVNETDKADLMKRYCGLIIAAYAPSEDAEAVLSRLLKNNFDYSNTQWYSYSSVKSDEGLFFCIENLRFSTESDAELTLKQNDIISR